MVTRTPKKGYRLFVACFVPQNAATLLVDWAKEELSGLPVKMLKPEQLHVTLMFFPFVSEEKKVVLCDLMRQVKWNPVQASTGPLLLINRSSLAVSLKVEATELVLLEDRLGRSSWHIPAEDGEKIFEYYKNLNESHLPE